MILATTKTVTVKIQGCEVLVTFKIPSAAEWEEVDGVRKNTEVVRDFVTKVFCSECAELDNAEALCNAPGSLTAVATVAKAIVESCIVTETEKN